MYCHRDIPVQLWECPHCGRALLRCRVHYILYGPEQTRCEIPGCDEELVYKGDVFLPYGVDLTRMNSILINRRNKRLTCIHANAPISPIIAGNTRGYFWKAERNVSKLCCFDFAKGEYVWPDDLCPSADFSVRGDSILNFELSGVYLITSLKDRVLLHLINDGKHAASVPAPDPEYRSWMIGRRLYILSYGKPAQNLAYYDPPYETEKVVPMPALSLSNFDDTAMVLPAIENGQAFFAGFDGSLIQLGASGETRVLFTPKGGSKIGYLALSGGYLVYTLLIGMNNGESVYDLHVMDIASMEDGVIAENIHLACAKPAVFNGRVFTCERSADGTLYFYEYPVSGGYTVNPYTQRWRISRAADIYDFYCAVCDNSLYFFYIAHSGSFNLIEACCMDGAGTAERLKTMGIAAQCGLINIYNHTILSDRNTGQIFAVKTL